MVVRCMSSTTSRSIERGMIPSFFQRLTVRAGPVEAIFISPSCPAEFVKSRFGQLLCDVPHFTALCLDTVTRGDCLEFFRVLYLVIARGIGRRHEKGMGSVAAMVGMRRGSACDHPGDIAGGDRVGVCAAYANPDLFA